MTAPKFPEFIAPAVPAALAGSARGGDQRSRGWAFLQAGDLKNAEREFAAALKAAPAFYPAETALGYVELARKDAEGGAAAFRSRARVSRSRDDVSALLGRGAGAARRSNREADALAAFEAALAVDPVADRAPRGASRC